MKKNTECEFIGEKIFQGHKCNLGYFGGKTTFSQCERCINLQRNRQEVFDYFKSDVKQLWKINSFSPPPKHLLINQKIKGLGDIVEIVAKPIAYGIDKILGTDIKNCNGCKKRKEMLNELFPSSVKS